MAVDPKAVEKGARSPYERPMIVKEKGMSFPSRILSPGGQAVVCKQCSSCHGCR